jgi:hypothetical protein
LPIILLYNLGSYRLLTYGFRVYFTRLTGVLFTFPSRYWSTIGHAGVFSLGRWASQLPTGFHGARGTWAHYPKLVEHFSYGTITLSGNVFQHLCLCSTFHFGNAAASPSNAPQHRITNVGRLPDIRFRLAPFRSPLLRGSQLLSFPKGTKMFQFPSLATILYGFKYGYWSMTPSRLPHSEIPGSTHAYHSPRLIAVSHVLHRLRVPRHPPYAIHYLTLIFTL